MGIRYLKIGLALLTLTLTLLLSCRGGQDQTDEITIHIDPYWWIVMKTGHQPADHFELVFTIDGDTVQWFPITRDTSYCQMFRTMLTPHTHEGYHDVLCGIIPYNAWHETWTDSLDRPIVVWAEQPVRIWLSPWGKKLCWGWLRLARVD